MIPRRMLVKILCLSCFFILFSTIITLSQDKKKPKKVNILPVPTFGNSPETNFYIGAVTLFTIRLHQDSSCRTSNAKIEIQYTWNKQIIVESGWNIFTEKERYFFSGLIHLSRYPDLYYGIGAYISEQDKIVFQSNRILFETYNFKRIGNNLFAGISTRYINYSDILPTKKLYPELQNTSHIGIGVALLRDTRNNLLGASTGSYVSFLSSANFSGKFYNKSSLDVRYYKTLGNKITLATKLFQECNFGNVPFYDYAYLGGDKLVRGYYYGKFRDKILHSLQVEIRSILFWRIGMAVFGGTSLLYSMDTKYLSHNNIKYNMGAGLRFVVDRKENIHFRCDYAIGEDGNNGFYIAFGESF
ncbi:MAG: BamA/TamA family outer membrane protein [Chitinophagaceae bacterium]|nr:BamA/TamA family outer membrane protein [Chitinophagaceae bacterium]